MNEKKKYCWWYDVCPMKYFYEQGILEERWVSEYCWVDNPECVRKKMEEEGKYHPDTMLPDGSMMEEKARKKRPGRRGEDKDKFWVGWIGWRDEIVGAGWFSGVGL